MSVLGHKRTLGRSGAMSGLPPKADMVPHNRDVRFVAKADVDPAGAFSSLSGHITKITQHKAENDEDPARNRVELLLADDGIGVAHQRVGDQNARCAADQ